VWGLALGVASCAVAAAAAADMAAGEEIDSVEDIDSAGLGVDSDWGSLGSEVGIGSSAAAGAGHIAIQAAAGGTVPVGSLVGSSEGAGAERAAGLGSASEVPPLAVEVPPLVEVRPLVVVRPLVEVVRPLVEEVRPLVQVPSLVVALPSARAAALVAVLPSFCPLLEILLAKGVSREGLSQNRLDPVEVRILFRAWAVRLCLGNLLSLEIHLSPYLDRGCGHRSHCRGCAHILACRLSASRPPGHRADRGRSPGRPSGHTAAGRLARADSVDLEIACDPVIRIFSARSASEDGRGGPHYSLCFLVFPLCLPQALEDDL